MYSKVPIFLNCLVIGDYSYGIRSQLVENPRQFFVLFKAFLKPMATIPWLPKNMEEYLILINQ